MRFGAVKIRSNVLNTRDMTLIPGKIMQEPITYKQKAERHYSTPCSICKRTIYRIYREGCDRAGCLNQDRYTPRILSPSMSLARRIAQEQEAEERKNEFKNLFIADFMRTNVTEKEEKKRKYPAENISKWLTNIREVFRLEFNIGIEELDYGVCICQTPRLLRLLKSNEERMHFLNGLFWSIWIDQVMYYVMHSSQHGLKLYSEFRRKYLFPKIFNHGYGGHASPCILLEEHEILELLGNKIDTKTLILGKTAFLDEVCDWLCSIGESAMKLQVMKEFKADQTSRFSEQWRIFF